MSFDPVVEGFAWPTETTLTNDNGEAMLISPAATGSREQQQCKDERDRELYRMYRTPNDPLVSERAVWYWQMGGEKVASEFLTRFTALFPQAGVLRPATEVYAALRPNFSQLVVDANLIWLEKRGDLSFDRERKLFGRK